MNRITITIPEEMDERFDELVESGEYESKSETVRGLIRQYEDDVTRYEERITEYETRVQELEDRNTELETKVERLEKQNLLILEQREEHTELVKQVEKEQSLSERKAQAGIVTRAKWFVAGMPDE